MNFSVVFDIESWTRVAALIMAKAPCHGRVTFNLSQSRFYLELSQRRVRQPLRVRSLRILATNETRIVDESGRLGEYQVMALRLFQLLPIILTALALVPSGAHLAALLLIGLFVEARPDLYPKSRNGEDRGRDRPRLRLPRLQ
jgi:hypothetical protein